MPFFPLSTAAYCQWFTSIPCTGQHLVDQGQWQFGQSQRYSQDLRIERIQSAILGALWWDLHLKTPSSKPFLLFGLLRPYVGGLAYYMILCDWGSLLLPLVLLSVGSCGGMMGMGSL
jgi:hypothetical protein